MQFRQLEYFVALARERHFARAAEACFVSQPALSAALAKLEHELGVALIRRDRAFQGLTPEGERLVLWARRVLAEQEAFISEVRAVQSGLSGRLTLGTGPSASMTSLLALEAFCAAHPLVTVRLESGLAGPELARRIREFELDAGIGYLAPEDRGGLEVTRLYDERYVLLVGDALLPVAPASMTWRRAAELPLALLRSEMRSRQLVDEVFAGHGLTVEAVIEADTVPSLYAAAQTGRWASIVPRAALEGPPAAGQVHVVALTEPELANEISVAINAGDPQSLIARTFVAEARRIVDGPGGA